MKLAEGQSYASVGQWALRRGAAMGREGESRSPKSAWHIGADWTEAAASGLFDHIDTQLRAAALGERIRLDGIKADAKALDRPQVVLVDDDPVTSSRPGRSGRKRQQDGFYILVVCELDWAHDNPKTRLRLARALSLANTVTWSLVFDELGYAPDILVADAATAISQAATNVFGSDTTQVPSLYHITSAIKARLLKMGAPARDPHSTPTALAPVLDVHLRKIHAGSEEVTKPAVWSTWWDEFTDIAHGLGLSAKPVMGLRAFHEPRPVPAMAVFNAYPAVPASTGAVEATITRAIDPILALRRTGCGCIGRGLGLHAQRGFAGTLCGMNGMKRVERMCKCRYRRPIQRESIVIR